MNKLKTSKLLFTLLGLLLAPFAFGDDLNQANTAWIMTSTALVLFMTIPGLSLFYAGLVRVKNVLSVLIQCFAITCLVSILWLVIGYSLAFSEGNAFIGGLSNFMMAGVLEDTLSGDIPESVFAMFQLTFAIITPALIVGGFAERMKFSSMLLFTGFWLLLVYAPVTHWVWGGGWLGELGLLDFAGGTVVHVTAGVAALTAALVMGSRKGFPQTPMPPHNMTMTVTGAGMLWVGWFGFNGGSVLSADPELTSLTLVTTCIAAAAGGVSAAIFSNILYKTYDLTMFMNGVLGGLVGITAGADQMSPTDATLIGLIAGIILPLGVSLIDKLKLDDPVGAIAVHLICGIWGTLAVGIFGAMAGVDQFITQLIGVGVIGAFSVVGAAIIIYAIKAISGIRVSEEEELKGLDLSEHSMGAYADFSVDQK